ncbi:MAG: hypothetical protein IJ789_00355 [Bacteroidales bacterium]|nr:hypothetical protein [Bacteroidales bacterium]
MPLNPKLTNLVFEKNDLKHQVYDATRAAFALFRNTARQTIDDLRAERDATGRNTNLAYTDRGDFEFEIDFASDVLIFLMHTNVFEFSRDHQVMKSQYIRDDNSRSYCGVIHIYNFLADSFTYQRDNDLGYLIGRIFINREGHYFIEGKRELGMLYNNFGTSQVAPESVRQIIESAIEYTTNFDLLTPPYDEIKVVSVGEMRSTFDKKSIITAKRLGFRFQSDTD